MSVRLITAGMIALGASVLFLIAASTPNQILSSAAPFYGDSDRDLRISMTYLLSQVAGVGTTPSTIASNAAAFQGMSDRDLLIAQTYLLNNLSGGFLVKSNTLASIPTLNPGDTYYWSSNGVAYVICNSPSGTLTTNKLGP